MARQVVISGASRGLGLELVRQCLARGDTVVGACRRPAAAEGLRACDGVHVLPLDVADEGSIGRFGTMLAGLLGAVDLLVHNAGVNATAFGAPPEGRGVLDLAGANFLDQMRVNAVGPMLLTRAVLPLLRAAQSPVIVHMSSQLGSLARGMEMSWDIGYNASKAALNMVSCATAGALGPEGMIVVALHPGWVSTDMGGPEAPLTPEASVRAMLTTIAGLGPAQNGAFLQWDGRVHPW